MRFNVYCDGSCRNNGSSNAIGAWGFVILDEEDNIISKECGEEYENVTNQRMEMKALLMACYIAETYINSAFDEIHIYVDSAYLHNCYNQKWYASWQNNGWKNSKKQPVANRDLWEKIIPYFEDIQFSLHKVPGHFNDKWNNYVDRIVQELSAQAKENLMNVDNN